MVSHLHICCAVNMSRKYTWWREGSNFTNHRTTSAKKRKSVCTLLIFAERFMMGPKDAPPEEFFVAKHKYIFIRGFLLNLAPFCRCPKLYYTHFVYIELCLRMRISFGGKFNALFSLRSVMPCDTRVGGGRPPGDAMTLHGARGSCWGGRVGVLLFWAGQQTSMTPAEFCGNCRAAVQSLSVEYGLSSKSAIRHTCAVSVRHTVSD